MSCGVGDGVLERGQTSGESRNPAEVSALVTTDAGVAQQGPVWGPRSASSSFLSL